MVDPAELIAAKLHELVLKNNGLSRGVAEMLPDAGAIASAIASECPIAWRPIGEIPFSLKGSGQDVLVWCDGGAVVGYWADSGPNAGSWLDQDDEVVNPSHYARIVRPGNQ